MKKQKLISKRFFIPKEFSNYISPELLFEIYVLPLQKLKNFIITEKTLENFNKKLQIWENIKSVMFEKLK